MNLERIVDHIAGNMLSVVLILGLLTQVNLDITREYFLNGKATTTYTLRV